MRESPFSGTGVSRVACGRSLALEPTRSYWLGTQLNNVLSIKLQNLFCPS